MPVDDEKLYKLLGQLISETPDFSGDKPLTIDQNRWLAGARALVEAGGDAIDTATVRMDVTNMHSVLRPLSCIAR